jgi:hypothetical protein
MTGILLNALAVLVGGTLGLFFGTRLPERFQSTIISGLGLFTLALGLYDFLKTQNPLIALGSLLLGGLVGEGLQIETGMASLGQLLEQRFGTLARGRGRLMQAFLTASLLFCVGPMTILGSIQNGLTGSYELLAVKSVMDGFAAFAFASSLGPGVLFSVIVILVYQGGISLLASRLNAVLNSAMLAEMTAVGGLMLMGIALSSLLEVRKIRVGNFLPALLFAPLLVWIVSRS